MPQPALHVALAEGLCRRWQRAPQAAPLAETTMNAFRHGSLGPDMGLFPGADREISRLAHTRAPSWLARSLLERAGNAVECAYVWGWVSHMIADIHVHPLVNAAAAVLPADSPGGRNREVGHVMVESGLDAWFLRRPGNGPGPRLRNVFGPGGARFIADAFDDVYDHDIDERRVFGYLRNITRWYSPYLLLAGRIADDHARALGDRRGPLGPANAFVRRLVGPDASATGFLEAEPPGSGLVQATREAIGRHDADVLRFVEEGLEYMQEYNLETGERMEVRAAA
jgi:hypothetical protein